MQQQHSYISRVSHAAHMRTIAHVSLSAASRADGSADGPRSRILACAVRHRCALDVSGDDEIDKDEAAAFFKLGQQKKPAVRAQLHRPPTVILTSHTSHLAVTPLSLRAALSIDYAALSVD